MHLNSSGNKSVYSINEEDAPPADAEYLKMGNEHWKLVDGEGDEREWEEVSAEDIPAGSNVYLVGSGDITSTEKERAEVEDELDIVDGADPQTGVKGGYLHIPGLVGAESQEGVLPNPPNVGAGDESSRQLQGVGADGVRVDEKKAIEKAEGLLAQPHGKEGQPSSGGSSTEQLNAKDTIAKVKSSTDKAYLQQLADNDERSTVVDAANARLEELG